jgi:hypothetical protein
LNQHDRTRARGERLLRLPLLGEVLLISTVTGQRFSAPILSETTAGTLSLRTRSDPCAASLP